MIVANRMSLVVLLLAVVLLAAGCPRGATNVWLGTYSNANGSITLDVKSGDKATITLMGDSKECPYTTQGEQTLTLNCPEDPPGKIEFSRQSDGSLVGPGLVGRLTKSQR
jgi:hypothetical protein